MENEPLQAFKVLALNKETNKMEAEYIFESMKEAIRFHAEMTVKGYLCVTERIAI
jgi:hypothetical protein